MLRQNTAVKSAIGKELDMDDVSKSPHQMLIVVLKRKSLFGFISFILEFIVAQKQQFTNNWKDVLLHTKVLAVEGSFDGKFVAIPISCHGFT